MSGKTLLLEAVESGHRDIATLLIENGADPSKAITQTGRLIDIAAAKGDISMMQILFAHQEVAFPIGSSALLCAVPHCHIDAAKFILEKGYNLYSDINISQEAQAVFRSAAAQGSHAKVQFCWSNRSLSMSKINMVTRPSFTRCRGVNTKSQNFYLKQVPILTPQSVELNSAKVGAQTPLFFAIGNGDDDLVKLLLDHDAGPDHEDEYGERAILWAAAEGYEPMVKMLLCKGTNVNCLEHSNESPLL
ncbi:ankyrin repeat-containing domain protein [Aspergillus sergii]|uniref:Ankyrin repeat-containing domain protein n=1 Tax=Aspergillus sergii TaxID=1034303 RepID=A0A5N6XAL9_9EURO|nr:ankyrin repeat-containing domain protein [Aspergillus sergii]